jgi:signal transduction histidine kinase
MPRPPPSRPPSRRLLLTLGVLITLEGLLAARVGFAPFAFQAALLWVACGWVTAGSGLVTWHTAPASRTGPLLVAAGAAAFLGSFAEVGWPIAGQLAALLTWSMVAILGQALLTHPDGRVRSARTWIPVVGLYLLVPLTPPDSPWLMGAGLLAALGARRILDGRDPRRGAADAAGVIAAAGLMSGALLDLLAPGIPLDQLGLQLGTIVSAAVLLAADTIRLAPLRAHVTDTVLLLDPASGRRVVDELRRATGDPTLGVAYPVADGGYVDDAGRPIVLPDPTSGRSVTTIAAGGRAAAVVIHDGRLETDAALEAAAGRALALSATNARLQGDLRAQLRELQDSRRRLLDAGDDARAALERRLAGGPLASLALLDGELEAAGPALALGTEPRATDDLAPVRAELDAVVTTLTRLAHGLHPPALETDGLAVALHALAARSTVPVTLSVDGLPAFSNPVASTAWFIASEALANVTKHAGAGRVDIQAGVRDGSLILEVVDDGRGGADPAAGSGLQGLRDRVDAMGGTVRLVSPAGGGTRLTAILPVTTP